MQFLSLFNRLQLYIFPIDKKLKQWSLHKITKKSLNYKVSDESKVFKKCYILVIPYIKRKLLVSSSSVTRLYYLPQIHNQRKRARKLISIKNSSEFIQQAKALLWRKEKYWYVSMCFDDQAIVEKYVQLASIYTEQNYFQFKNSFYRHCEKIEMSGEISHFPNVWVEIRSYRIGRILDHCSFSRYIISWRN